MPTQYRYTVELELNGKVTASRSIYYSRINDAIRNLQVIAKRSTSPYSIYVTKRSKVNSIIKMLKDDAEINL